MPVLHAFCWSKKAWLQKRFWFLSLRVLLSCNILFYRCYLALFTSTSSLVAQTVKRLPTMWETWVGSLGWEDPLEKEMATHSSILAWRIPWTEEPGGLQSVGLQRVGQTERLHFHFSLHPRRIVTQGTITYSDDILSTAVAMGWGGRWEGGPGWGAHVHPWLIHVHVWQKPLQYCKAISLQLK